MASGIADSFPDGTDSPQLVEADREAQPNRRAGRHPVERVHAHAQDGPVRVIDELGERRRNAARGGGDWQVEQRLDFPGPGHAGERARHVGNGVESLRRRVASRLGERSAPDSVDAERAQVVATVIVGGEIPAA